MRTSTRIGPSAWLLTLTLTLTLAFPACGPGNFNPDGWSPGPPSVCDQCAGGSVCDGMTTQNNDAPLHAGQYSAEECALVCDEQFDGCAPTVLQDGVNHTFRCGEGPLESCGDDHQPRE